MGQRDYELSGDLRKKVIEKEQDWDQRGKEKTCAIDGRFDACSLLFVVICVPFTNNRDEDDCYDPEVVLEHISKLIPEKDHDTFVKEISPHALPRNSLQASHLAFDDDLIVFTISKKASLTAFKDFIDMFDMGTGRTKCSLFQHNIDKIRLKLSSLKSKLLSQVDARKIQRRSWDVMCHPTEENGSGIWKWDVLETLGLKLWWKFRQASSLWALFMKAKYTEELRHLASYKTT
ncbi:hypothetical protein ACH5RR_008929 [Cinchona calisaya]|uniref:Reverse transcriptase domain-containing protein n=1 Tax=Cinchona calisaya TaxID=153742 RepID=A0ABD3AGK4_9GENT